MKFQNDCELQSGKLVHQLLGGITFAYDIHLGRLRDHWKGISYQGVEYLKGPTPCF